MNSAQSSEVLEEKSIGKSLPRRLKRFLQETPFHGFNLVSNSSNKFEFVIWWLMILGCVCMTAYQTFYLVDYYQSEPTMSIITIRQNYKVDTRNPHICFGWHLKPIGFGLISHLKVDKILANLSETDLNDIRMGNINTSDEIMPSTIWRLVLEMLIEVSSQELNVFYGRHQQTKRGGSNPKRTEIQAAINPLLHKISNFFASHNISLLQLAKATAILSCKLMSVKVTMTNVDVIKGKGHKSPIEVCRIAAFSNLNRDGFCLHMIGQQQLSFGNKNDWLQAEVYPQNMLKFYGYDGNMADLRLAIDLIGGKSVDTLNGYPIFSPYGSQLRTYVDIQGSYKSFSTRRRPCSNWQNQWDCSIRCRGEFIWQKCQCWPLSFTSILNEKEREEEIPICGGHNITAANSTQPYIIPDLGSCLVSEAIWSSDPAYECLKSCRPDCSHLKLSFTSETYVGARCHNCTIQTVKISSFSYPHIEEVSAKSLESLVAEFGGLVGLWLGGSVIAFSHLVIFVLKLIHGGLANAKMSEKAVEI